MLIDVHAHLVGVDPDNGCYVKPSMRRGLLFQYLKHTLGLGGVPEDQLDDAYRDKLVDWAADSELDAVGVLAMDGVYDREGQLDEDRTSVLISNDYCLEVCRDADPLLPICSINPHRSDAIEELDRVVEAGSAAIKMLPNSQGIDPADPAHRPFWERMSELGVPLLTHTSFEHTIPVLNQDWGHPRRLTPVLDEGVTVIAAHCASAGVMHLTEHFDIWRDMIRTYPNLYGDISAMASMARFSYIGRVLDDEVASERVMLGSDFPIPVSPWLFLNSVGWSEMTRLTGIENPLQRNLETFRSLGCGQSILRRGQRVLRV